MTQISDADSERPRSTAMSKALLERAALRTPGGVQSNVRLATRPHPLFFERGEGVHLIDVDGNRYVDFVLGQGPLVLGHAHPAIVAEVSDALSRGQLFGGQHRSEVELAEILCDVLPCAERVRFSSSGSEAVQAALRLARAATGRRRVLKFEGHYHGWIDSVYVSVTPSKLAPGGSKHACCESRGQVVPEPDQITVLPWNDAKVVAEELAAGDVAAVLMEPVPANNSVILPQPGFLERVRRECDRRGTMLVFDEIITGFRLALGGAQERLGVVPDLAIFGKAMASGFPIACVAGRESAFDGVAENQTVLAGTFSGNMACVRAALATVRTLRDQPELYRHAEKVGRVLMDGILASSRGDLVAQGLPSMFWIGFGEGEVFQARDVLRFDQQRTLELSGELCAPRRAHDDAGRMVRFGSAQQ